jgi:hypothetical protein
VCGKFYKATVQAVLLYGSKTWNLTPSAMKRLEGFHLRAAWKMAAEHVLRRDPVSGEWTYPVFEDVLEEVGLFPIDHYIGVRRQTIASFIVHQPIFDFCLNGRRRRGSSPCQFWWEQPMDLDLAQEVETEEAETGSEEEEEEESEEEEEEEEEEEGEEDGLGLDN